MGEFPVFLIVMNELSDRQKKILRRIVLSYIQTASPVGSAHLVATKCVECSAATVRNEMASLEDMGFIEQPHTSAGRIPTDMGYRYYVNHLIKWEPVESNDEDALCQSMEAAGGDVKKILEEASRILGVISSELGVVLTPWMAWGVFDRLELIELSYNKVLAVIHVRSRLVKTVIFELQVKLSQKELQQSASILNERLSGLTLEEVKNTITTRLKDATSADRDLLRVIVDLADSLFDFSEPLDIHTSGTRNLICKPEFTDSSKMGYFFTLIDDRRQLMALFNKRDSVTEIVIGQENKDDRLQPFTVISSSYRRGKDVGSFGVIGPKRMSYRRVVPLVETMSKTMSMYLS